MKPSKRDSIFFDPQEGAGADAEGASFVKTAEGRLVVVVSEEKAVDSYNESFECCLDMTAEQAAELRDWLNEKFPKGDSKRRQVSIS